MQFVFFVSRGVNMLSIQTVLVQHPIPALLNKDFPMNTTRTRAVSYPEGIVLLEDDKGRAVMDENFQYIDLPSR
jgi:hypothetical protein